MRNLSIAYGNSSHAKKWSNKTITFVELCERLKVTIRTSESVEEYPRLPKTERDLIKDKGGFVGGRLREGRRKRENVECRSMLTHDADHADKDFISRLQTNRQFASCLYTTHGHTPEAPRLRIITPLTRDVTPDEYVALARLIARDWGIDQFDECSYRPHQLMYWPTTPANGEYIFEQLDGDWLDPDKYLAAFPYWRDITQLPTSSRESEARSHAVQHQEDPLVKKGVVGAYCRAYAIEDAIDTFLTDIYEPSAMPGRYDYIPADSSAGVVVYAGKFAYSHHASDPASGKLLNAFDLVRVHKFISLDEAQSYKAMCEFAVRDEKVNALILAERQGEASKDFADDDWIKHLKRDRNGQVINSLQNILLILQNDPNLKSIVFNQMADGMEKKGSVPWNSETRYWRDADDAQLISYIDTNYGTFSERNYNIGVTKVADDRSYHPIREFLDSLPPWDGVPRLDTLLHVYLGADDNQYVRAVTRKTFVAAIARVYHPGIKFDYMLVLNGAQGIGKSTFVARLAGDWYTDSLTISDMNDKTAAEKLQGFWLVEIGELAGMKKADIDKVKAFISRQDDKYRASFGRRVTPHPRQNVIFGTTNSINGFLRDPTGNRRFWIVKTPGTGAMQSWQLTQSDVIQVWAEAMVYYKAGEKLYLDADLEKLAKSEQRDALEQDDREGVVREYLDMLLPEKWSTMDLYERQEFIRSPENPTMPVGVNRRDTVCNLEIWCECFGKNRSDMHAKETNEMAAIMARIENWIRTDKTDALPIYGKQRLYIRCEQE